MASNVKDEFGPKDSSFLKSNINSSKLNNNNNYETGNKKDENKDLSLSKILDVKLGSKEEFGSEGISRRVESEKEIPAQGHTDEKENKVRKGGKLTTVIKQFGSSKKKQKPEDLDKAVLRNMNVSMFKKLAAKNDPLVKSILTNSKLVTSLGKHFLGTQNKYEEALKDCQNWNKVFTDGSFPPSAPSLAQQWSSLNEKQQRNWSKYVWRRASDIFSEFDIFLNSIEPNDIRQGQLGDCYLLSSLSSLAEREHLVRKLFQPEKKSLHGLYSVWLNVNGMWTNVLVDDYFPCVGEKGSPAFSRGNGNEIWVLILEKAYAKVFGSYQAIEGGNPAVALRDLTGAPYENKDDLEENDMWEYIKENDEAGEPFLFLVLKQFRIYIDLLHKVHNDSGGRE